MQISVMLVDDSAVVRGLLRRLVEREKDMIIVSTAYDGEEAVRKYKDHSPDVIVMDIEMPNMDGISAVRALKKIDQEVKILMCSSLTKSGAKSTYEALSAGALDYVSKPSSHQIERGQDFEELFLRKIRDIASLSLVKKSRNVNASNNMQISRLQGGGAYQSAPQFLGLNFPQVMAFGSSTGGPTALMSVLEKTEHNIKCPIFISQHIPQGFSKFLAENIQSKTGFKAFEAEDGMPVCPGNIYIAPGGMHMGVTGNTIKKIKLIDTPPVNFCKPSINVMLDSLKETYGGSMLIILLTGMGEDGKEACTRIIEAKQKNIIIAQDEQTSVVWGIPGAIVKGGLAHLCLPINEIGKTINTIISKGHL